MAKFDEHPTVISYRRRQPEDAGQEETQMDYEWLRQLCLEAGADDIGFVSIDRPELDDQRRDLLAAAPYTKTLISIVGKMNREPIRSPSRSVANVEFHVAGDHVNEVGHRIVGALEAKGIRALNPAMGFPMDMDHFPGKAWVVSHKPVAVAAGLGMMGIHRNVIHPKFGNFILLGTVLVGARVSRDDYPIAYNPCLECRLCVAACPVGAISPDGEFNFSSCNTHNYREFMSGFSDWVETVVASKNVPEYRKNVSLSETVSWWQSLSYGSNYKAAYCMAVCPAGEDVIGAYIQNRKNYVNEVLRPLQDKVETIYVVPGSDAEAHVGKRFPHKRIKRVSNGMRLVSIHSFISELPRAFQPKRAADLAATYHFNFTGSEARQVTIRIAQGRLEIRDGFEGKRDILISVDSKAWLAFLAKEKNILNLLLLRKLRIRGSPKLLLQFGKCFSA